MAGAYPVFKGMKTGFGGAEINLYYLSKTLAQKDEYDVRFIVGDYSQSRRIMIENVSITKIKYLNHERYGSYFHKVLARALFCFHLLFDSSDIYICSTASDFFAFIILVAQGMRRKKVIFRAAHDWDVNGHFTKGTSILGMFHRFALPRADAIVTQNEDQKRALKEIEGLQSIVIRNGFPINNTNVQTSREYFLWVARADEFKRPHLYLQLAKKLPDYKFVMILADNNQLQKDILVQSREIGNLKLVDGCGFFEILNYFKEAICLVNTSTAEGFPNTFIQAGLAKTPILSLKVNPDRMLDFFNMGFCCNDDLDKAADFIRSLTPEKIQLMGIEAFNYVRSTHDIEEKIQQYIEVFKKIK
jgi:glycosyltransferase involved in cell wall biosynthesis